MRRNLALLALALLIPTGAAQACGRRYSACRHRRVTAYAALHAAYVHTYASPQAVPASASPVMTEAVPSYEYPSRPGAGGAYYYTYDGSGKLIVQQWVDFVFRGGKEAGMPRPPLPVIGYLRPR